MGILLVIGLAWGFLAMGAALVLGRAIRLRDLRASGLHLVVPEVASLDERILHHV